jgi:UDP:flavonoid glycosyltransferase YjiC (YdhE family)
MAIPRSPRTVLLMAEAVTLAHYARIAVLARALPAADYRVVVAADPRYRELDPIPGVEFHPIRSISSAQFACALARGDPVYDAATLYSYVEEDLRVIEAVGPAAVVGDFRISLGISARRAGVPYLSVADPYWSPRARVAYPVPELPATRFLPIPLAQCVFDAVRPLAFRLHARPYNVARRRFGLPALAGDVRHVYTDADGLLYAGLPELVEVEPRESRERYIGPLLWRPEIPLPQWWNDLPENQLLAYVTLGSSGRAALLAPVVQALTSLGITPLVADGGRAGHGAVFRADFLPGEAAAARAALVVCNGGSPTCYQALAHGEPVLGLPSNLDQYLNMSCVAGAGAGMLMRADRATVPAIAATARRLLDEPGFRAAAIRLEAAIGERDAAAELRAALGRI